MFQWDHTWRYNFCVFTFSFRNSFIFSFFFQFILERVYKLGERKRKNLKKTPHWVQSPTWGSIARSWEHDLKRKPGVGCLTDCSTEAPPKFFYLVSIFFLILLLNFYLVICHIHYNILKFSYLIFHRLKLRIIKIWGECSQ